MNFSQKEANQTIKVTSKTDFELRTVESITDFPQISLFDEDLPLCQSVKTIVMEPEQMYDSFTELKKPEQNPTAGLPFDDSLHGLLDLDPTLELSVDLQQLLEAGQDTGLSTPNLSSHVNQEQLFPIVPEFFSRTTDSPEPVQTDTTAVIEVDDEESMPQVPTFDTTPTGSWSFVKDEPVSPCASAAASPSPAVAPGEHNYFTVEPATLVEDFCKEEEEVDATYTPKSYSPKATSSKSNSNSRRKNLDKGSEEYRARRQRNNVAVRKSRDKAKNRQKETEQKVKELTSENERLQKKVDLLSKELNVLKGLFTNVGAELPPEVQRYLAS